MGFHLPCVGSADFLRHLDRLGPRLLGWYGPWRCLLHLPELLHRGGRRCDQRDFPSKWLRWLNGLDTRRQKNHKRENRAVEDEREAPSFLVERAIAKLIFHDSLRYSRMMTMDEVVRRKA